MSDDGNTDEGRRHRKEKSYEELDRLLADPKNDADRMSRNTHGRL